MTFPRGEGCVGVCEIYWAGSLLIGHGLIQDNEDCRYLLVSIFISTSPYLIPHQFCVHNLCITPGLEFREWRTHGIQ